MHCHCGTKNRKLIQPSVCPSVCLATKSLTWFISSEVVMIEHWYVAWQALSIGTMPWHWPWHLTYFKVNLFECQSSNLNSREHPYTQIYLGVNRFPMRVNISCLHASGSRRCVKSGDYLHVDMKVHICFRCCLIGYWSYNPVHNVILERGTSYNAFMKLP